MRRQACFIATSSSPLASLFDRAFLGFHPDYPLLLPSLVSRGWQYSGIDTTAVPMLLSALFTIAAVITSISAIRMIGNRQLAFVGGTVVFSTPFLLEVTAWQYADIAMGCFITAGVAAFVVYDSDEAHTHKGLPIVAGIAAAAAACTKN